MRLPGGDHLPDTRLRPDADGRLAFTADWSDAPKWDVHTPGNLLTCALELRDAAGTPLDAALPFRFGFRDIRAVGRDLRLNGTTIHLRALYNRNMNGSTALAAKETCRALCRRLTAEGFNYIIAGNYDFAPGTVSYMDGLLEACDEEGMLFSFSLPHIRDFGVQLDRPEVAARYRARARWCIRRARNHPSVVTYAMNHNATGYCGDMNPLRIDGRYELKEDAAHRFRNRSQAKIAAAIARSLDATRPIYHHESGNLDDFHTVNIYLNWSPVQERSDWLEHWSAQGVKPLFFVEWGMPHISSWSSYRGPLFIWRKAGYQSLWASEFAAAFRGDAAYEGATPEAVRALAREEALWAQGKPMFWGHLNAPIRGLTNNYHGVQALYMDDNWRSHRAWGISAMLPWDQGAFHTRVRPASARPNPARWEKLKAPGVVPDWFPDGEWDVGTGAEADFARTKVGDVLYRWNREDCAFIGGAGVFTDKRHHYRPGEELRKTLVILNDRRVEQEVAWTWTLAETTRAGTARVPAGGRVDVPLACTLPQKAGAWELKAAFTFAGGAVQRDAFALETYAPAKTARVENLLLCDPVGLTAKAFDRLGIAYGRTDGRTALPDAARLVVGRGALTRTLFHDVVVPAARRRGRVLIFEQDKETLESIGFRAQNYGLRNAFARYPEPRLALTGAKLRDWNGAATLIPTHLQNRRDRDGLPARALGRVRQHARVALRKSGQPRERPPRKAVRRRLARPRGRRVRPPVRAAPRLDGRARAHHVLPARRHGAHGGRSRGGRPCTRARRAPRRSRHVAEVAARPRAAGMARGARVPDPDQAGPGRPRERLLPRLVGCGEAGGLRRADREGRARAPPRAHRRGNRPVEPREARGRPDERLLRLPHRETAAGTERPLERRLGLARRACLHGVHRAGGGRQRGPARRAVREGRARLLADAAVDDRRGREALPAHDEAPRERDARAPHGQPRLRLDRPLGALRRRPRRRGRPLPLLPLVGGRTEIWYDCLRKRSDGMQTMLNVREAKADFSKILSHIEKDMVSVTIMRSGRPIARLSPITTRRSVKPMRKYVGKVRLVGDACADTTADWEALHAPSPS